MNYILKFRLGVTGEQEITMPEKSMFLTVQTQGEDICLWALCDPDDNRVSKRFVILGTGHKYPEEKKLIYLGTVHQDGYVWHIFEEKA